MKNLTKAGLWLLMAGVMMFAAVGCRNGQKGSVSTEVEQQETTVENQKLMNVDFLGAVTTNNGKTINLWECISDGIYAVAAYADNNGNDEEVSVANCYSTMTFTPTNTYSANAIGGMIGGHDKTTKRWTVSGLLAWHQKISFPNMGNATYGVIAGQMHSGSSTAATSFSNCWYRANLDYSVKGVAKTPRSDDDVTAGGKNPYDGKPADEGETCSQKAQGIGWSADIWNFDEEYPVLKDLPSIN